MNEELDLEELFNKEFYIVDCSNFIFYPADNNSINEMKELGIYSALIYDDLILP